MSLFQRLCQIKYSNERVSIPIPRPSPFSYTQPLNIKYEPTRISQLHETTIQLIDPQLETEIESYSDIKTDPLFLAGMEVVYPSSYRNPSIFIDSNAVELSEIDLVFNISGHIGNFLSQQTLGNFTFLSLNGQEGSWVQYIQYRRPQGYGYGITPNNIWQDQYIDMTRFNVLTGNDGTGNVDTNIDWISNKISMSQSQGVMLILGQGDDLLSQILVMIGSLQIGGCVVFKIDNCVTSRLYQLIMLLCGLFDENWIYTPLLSWNRYFIGKGFHGNQGNSRDIIVSLYQFCNTIQVDPSFYQWFIHENNKTYTDYLQIYKKTQSYIKQDTNIDIPQYNFYRYINLLNLPDSTNEPIKIDYRNSLNYLDGVTTQTNPANM